MSEFFLKEQNIKLAMALNELAEYDAMKEAPTSRESLDRMHALRRRGLVLKVELRQNRLEEAKRHFEIQCGRSSSKSLSGGHLDAPAVEPPLVRE